MGRRDELIAIYAEDLREKCGVTPDPVLLEKVAKGLGPSIYRADAALVSGSDRAELETLKKNYLMKRLGLADGPELMAGIETALETYGRGNRQKHRAVVCYLLAKHFGREAAYA
jgi:hypothetical protein